MIKRVKIKNYRSLANVEVDFEDFTVLVGPNGAGKSNFVDALSFLADCLNTTIDAALQKRGGINAVRRKSAGHPNDFGVNIDFDFPMAIRKRSKFETKLLSASYAFEIKAQKEAKYIVKKESCRIWGLDQPEISLKVESGLVKIEMVDDVFERTIEEDRLGLQIFSGFPQLRPVYNYLTTMRFYSLVPDHIRKPQEVNPGKWLEKDGANSAAILRNISSSRNHDDYERICKLLSKAVPGITKVSHKALGQFETLAFKQEVQGVKDAWQFDTYNMSDGTLRILGILLAVYQNPSASCLFIEEPESTVHPAAADLIVDILQVARKHAQVVITTHSPDILDNKNLDAKQIRYVENNKGITSITPIDPLSRDMVKEKLYSLGELLRENKLKPDKNYLNKMSRTLDLFSKGG
ncbi:MAG: AAA family ATPase [bacterium]|nr:AAA family ATPase [bacterium]